MNSTILWVAAAVSALCWGIHTFVGGGQIVPQLKGSDLPNMPKYVLYFVWHIATIVIAALAIGFALAAIYPAAWPLAVQATIVSFLIALLIIFVALRYRMAFKDMPQWTIFLAMAAIGAAAIWF